MFISSKENLIGLTYIISFVFLLYVVGQVNAGERSKPDLPRGSFACSNAVKKFEKWSEGFEHAAVAVGKARTVSGIRGCGWAWGFASVKKAKGVALANCRKRAFYPETCVIMKSN